MVSNLWTVRFSKDRVVGTPKPKCRPRPNWDDRPSRKVQHPWLQSASPTSGPGRQHQGLVRNDETGGFTDQTKQTKETTQTKQTEYNKQHKLKNLSNEK